MSLPIRAVIFDLDGTLVDSLEDIADTANDALKARGFPAHPVDAYRYFVGDGIQNMVRRASPDGTDDEVINALVAEAHDAYSAGWNQKTRPYAGIEAMLRELEGRGIALAVLSNKLHEFTQDVVAHFFPQTPFKAIQGSPRGSKAKPDPTLALRIASELGVPPQQTLFMGDTRTDMDTATAAGMVPAGVLWGFRPERELLDHGAQLILREPGELFLHIL